MPVTRPWSRIYVGTAFNRVRLPSFGGGQSGSWWTIPGAIGKPTSYRQGYSMAVDNPILFWATRPVATGQTDSNSVLHLDLTLLAGLDFVSHLPCYHRHSVWWNSTFCSTIEKCNNFLIFLHRFLFIAFINHFIHHHYHQPVLSMIFVINHCQSGLIVCKLLAHDVKLGWRTSFATALPRSKWTCWKLRAVSIGVAGIQLFVMPWCP